MNRKFLIESGHAALLPIPNIDTDIIIPQTELVTASKRGLKDGLFARWRYLEGRTPNPDFILNRPEHKETCFLIAAHNFGCGSSREHAAWALADFGIRAVISPKFGEIFHRNCVRNGILPAVVSEEDYARLAVLAESGGSGMTLVIDLQKKRISNQDISIGFDIEQSDANRLLLGADEIQETFAHSSAIQAFVARDSGRRPWIYEASWNRLKEAPDFSTPDGVTL